jgi:membrane fusion protein
MLALSTSAQDISTVDIAYCCSLTPREKCNAMTTKLYRQEALDHLNSLQLAAPIALPRAQRSAAILALVSVLMLIVWVFSGSYTRRAPVVGLLEPRGGLAQVHSSRPGKIARMHVSVGTRVKEGDTLFTLASDEKTEVHGNSLNARLAQLSSDQMRLQDDLAIAKRSFEQQRRALVGELRSARKRTKRLRTLKDIQTERVSIKKDVLRRLTPLLNQGYISTLQYKDVETEYLQARSDLEAASSQHEDAKQEEATLSSRMSRLSDDLAEKSSATGDKLSSVLQTIVQTDTARELLVTAPIDGEVTNIFVSEGSNTSPPEALATIIPNGPLIGRIIVDSSTIGFLRIGTPVAIRYRSFPYEKFGAQRGIVSRIPRSAMLDQQVLISSGATTGSSAYRIDVELANQNVNVYGTQEQLRAGMEFTADVMLDRRTLIEWMFEPLIGIGKRMEIQGSTE